MDNINLRGREIGDGEKKQGKGRVEGGGEGELRCHKPYPHLAANKIFLKRVGGQRKKDWREGENEKEKERKRERERKESE